MSLAALTYVTLIARDVDRLADFYGPLLGLQEIAASRSEKYREFLTGGVKLGVAYAGAYAMLGLAAREPAEPVNTVLTFDVGALDQVAPLTRRAVRLGGRLVKPGFDTFFGQHQSVVKDPEGNVFRLSAAL